eukprot:TRINITY_DN20858_c0_g1_i1.p1 TRINITY_DN20858_c0_g1~~TRINITY_DN20858_c0_g1_i1.p1  ORF type:complete len:474 (-),score=70.00 TRINITY_DN20858_c0_g1_i1:119-1540(-)
MASSPDVGVSSELTAVVPTGGLTSVPPILRPPRDVQPIPLFLRPPIDDDPVLLRPPAHDETASFLLRPSPASLEEQERLPGALQAPEDPEAQWQQPGAVAASSSSSAMHSRQDSGDEVPPLDLVETRVAFAEAAPAGPPGAQTKLSLCALSVACLAEAIVVVPTIHFEARANIWSFLLRVLICIVRLSPVVTTPIFRLLCSARGLPERFVWFPIIGDAAPTAAGAAATPNLDSNAGSGGLQRGGLSSALRQRIDSCWQVARSAFLCPEVRWGVAITLDMWQCWGVRQSGLILLLVLNVLMCFGDTVMLILMLAAKTDDYLPEVQHADVLACRPKDIVFSEEEATDGKLDPMCIICLGEFRDGEEAAQLPCNHVFHNDCIGQWLSKSRHCPLRCPRRVLPPLPYAASAPAASGHSSEVSAAVPEAAVPVHSLVPLGRRIGDMMGPATTPPGTPLQDMPLEASSTSHGTPATEVP